MKISTNPVRGCIDYMPTQTQERQIIINSILNAYKNNGFLQIKTPILENLNLLCKSDEGENTKLMFKTIKRGEKLNLSKENLSEEDIVEEGLRYDLTVPLVRFFADNYNDLPYPFKSIQIDESFRAERPQKGRYRQFTQCDIDILGEEGIIGEVEIITTVMQAYKNAGLSNLVIKLSSRKILQELILSSGFKKEEETGVCILIDKIDKIGLEGCRVELLNNGYNKESVSVLCDFLSAVRQGGLESLQAKGVAVEECLKTNQIIQYVKPILAPDFDILFDIGIVRGQGYYTGTVFEVFQKQGVYKGALGGGGRYDNMIEKIIDKKVPAVGFGLGLDVVLLVMKEQGLKLEGGRKKIAVIYEPNDNIADIFKLKIKLAERFDTCILPAIKNLKELERKLKLNSFNGIIIFKNQNEIKWF